MYASIQAYLSKNSKNLIDMENLKKINLLFILATLCLLIYNFMPIVTLEILFINDSYFFPKETPIMVPFLIGAIAVSIIAISAKDLKTKRLMANILIVLVACAIIGTLAFIYFITYFSIHENSLFSIHENSFKIIPSFGIIFGFLALIFGISIRSYIKRENNHIHTSTKLL